MKDVEFFKSKEAPHPLAPYSHLVRTGHYIFTCGMGPRHPETNQVAPNFSQQARQCFQNLFSLIQEKGLRKENIIALDVFLTRQEDFGAMNQVYREFFKNHEPVRTTLGVSFLPGNILIELKAILYLNQQTGS